MIRERETVIEKSSVIFQTIFSFISFRISIFLFEYYTISTVGQEYIFISYLIFPVWYLLLDHMGMGRMLRMKMYSNLFFEYITVTYIGVASLLIMLGLMDNGTSFPQLFILFGFINFFVLFTYKILVYKAMKLFRRKGYNYRQIIVMADDDSDYFINHIINTKDWGYKIHAIVTTSETIKKKYTGRYKIISDDQLINDILDIEVVDEVMFCKSNFDQDKIRTIINLCAEIGVTFRIQSELLNVAGARSRISYVNHFPFLTFMNTPDNYLALKTKWIMDYLGAVIILILLSPLFTLIALAIKIDDGGPVFFKQVRVGRNGRTFNCLKFRTMVTNAEDLKASLMHKNEQKGPVFKIKDDPRVTRVGRFLRSTSFDELPQFLNVLKGEMSIVGPRPPIPSEVESYERWQRRRLSMKPGITCIWQVSGRNNIPFDQWMKMDLQYIDSWSIKLDILLVLRTVKVVLLRDGQ